MKTKIVIAFLAAFGLAAAAFSRIESPIRVAEAQSAGPSAGPGTVTWNQNELKAVFSGDASSIALLISAVTGANHNIRAMQISGTTSGEISFYKGSVVSGPNYIGGFTCLANSPNPIPEWILRRGLQGGLSNPIYIKGQSGTTTLVVWYRDDPQ